MTFDVDTGQPRRRAASVENAIHRQARELAGPFRQRIEPWQKRLAYLRVVKSLKGQDMSSEAGELVTLAIAARIELEGELSRLDDPVVASHPVILSVRSALVRLREELEILCEW